MEIVNSKQRGSRSRVLIRSSQVVLCVLIFGFLATSLFAQMQKIGGETPVILIPTMPDDRVVLDRGDSKPGASENKVCSIQPFPGMPDTASVTTLQVPHKAQKEFEAACAALKVNKIPETERHLRKATEIYPQYARRMGDAWADS